MQVEDPVHSAGAEERVLSFSERAYPKRESTGVCRGLIFEGLLPVSPGRMSRSDIHRSFKTLKDQTTSSRDNGYALEERDGNRGHMMP